MLLWTLMLALWTLAVAGFSRGLPPALRARVIGVLGAISVGFLLFLLFAVQPVHPPAAAGHGRARPEPAAAGPRHGGSIRRSSTWDTWASPWSFAFAVAALLGGRLDAAWARWARPWTTLAWSFLTIGILLGSAWAYYELGWGGWWFWDPVENASLMPWLAGTALMHSLAVTEKRGAFRAGRRCWRSSRSR